MATWKKVIVSGSNISQLNNDSGYLTSATVTSPNGFATASFSGTNLLADSPSGSLNFASSSGQGLTISANAGNDTLTFGLSSIPNSSLANSTISGIALGNNLNALTLGAGLTGTSYNGSAAVTATVNSGSMLPFYSSSIFNRVSGDILINTSSGVATIQANSVALATDISGFGTGIATALAVNVGSAGAPVLFNGAGGTPTSITLTNGTGLPISTGVSGLGSGIATFLATPSSANLRSAVTDETGTGNLVFSASPTFTGAITASIISASSGITGASITTSGNATVGGTLGVTGNTTLTGDIAVNGGDITTTSTTFNLVNGTATTVNFAGGASTALNIGNASGTTTFASNVVFNKDITVIGTASFQETTNLSVADRFILLASGSGTSPSGDGGIVIQQTGSQGVGEAFGWDATNTSRWGVTSSFSANQAGFTPDAFMALAIIGSGTAPTSVAARYSASGNLFIGTDETIWIYS